MIALLAAQTGEFTVPVAPGLLLWILLWAILLVITARAYAVRGQPWLLGVLVAVVFTPIGSLLLLWLMTSLGRRRGAQA